MQVAITSALASAFTKHSPLFSSAQYQYLAEEKEEPDHYADKPFPFDVKFLSKETLKKLESQSVFYNEEFWPIERIHAYQGRNLCAKRAAVTPFLWKRYSEYPQMALPLLEKWHHVEVMEQLLKIPLWFRNQHVLENNISLLWEEKLGNKREQYEQEHMKILDEIKSIMNII